MGRKKRNDEKGVQQRNKWKNVERKILRSIVQKSRIFGRKLMEDGSFSLVERGGSPRGWHV